jgi:hypothetical protein
MIGQRAGSIQLSIISRTNAVICQTIQYLFPPAVATQSLKGGGGFGVFG